MAQGDFVIPPSEGLSMPGGSSYGTAISSLRQAGAGVQDIFSQLGKAANQLYAIRNDQMEAASQGDLLHIINDLNDTAAQLGSDPNGMTPIYSDTGNVDEQGNAEKAISGYNLGAAWEKKMDDWQKVLTEKYAAFPTIQAKVLTQFRDAAVSANKYAIDAAAKNSLEQGKTESFNNIQMGIQAAIKSGGDTSQLDATLANPSTVNFLGKSTVEAQRTAAYKTVGDSVLQNQLDKITVAEGPDAAIQAIPKYIDEQKRRELSQHITAADNAQQGVLEKDLRDKLVEEAKVDPNKAMLDIPTSVDNATMEKLKARIQMVSSATLGAMTTQAIKTYDDGVANKNIPDADARALAKQNLPDAYKDEVGKNLDSYANNKVTQAKLDANVQISKDFTEKGPEEAMKNLLNTDNKYFSRLGTDFDARYNFLKSAIDAKTAEADHVDWTKPVVVSALKIATNGTDDQPSKIAKLWALGLNGAEMKSAIESITNNSPQMANHVDELLKMAAPDPISGKGALLTGEEAYEGINVLTTAYRQAAQSGKPMTPADLEDAFSEVKKMYTDPVIRKMVEKLWQNDPGFLGTNKLLYGEWNTGTIQTFVQDIQAGNFKSVATTEQGKKRIASLNEYQQNELAVLLPSITISKTLTAESNGLPIYQDSSGTYYSQVNIANKLIWVAAPKGTDLAKYNDPSKWKPLVGVKQ